MNERPWHQSTFALILVSVLLPPLGLTLLWMRPRLGVSRKLLGTLGIGVLTLFYLHLVFGIRVEMDGTGRFPIVSLHDRESHYAALERSRIEQEPIREELISSTPAPAEETPLRFEPATESPVPEASMLLEAAPPDLEPAAPRRTEWTDYRGPDRDGRYVGDQILLEWPQEGLTPLWKQPVGGGYASFVIAGGRAFTIEQRRQQEVVTAYDVETGVELWNHAWDAEFREAMGGDGPRATPTWHEGRLFALGATGHLVCLETDSGRAIWSTNILKGAGAENLPWGMSASPLVVDEQLIVLPGGTAGHSVAAYHKDTGELLWSALNDKQAYTSPMHVHLAGVDQILVVSAQRAMGLVPTDGTVLWEFPWITSHGVNSAQPLIVDDHHFFISAGYGHGAALVEVSRQGERFTARSLWSNLSMKNKFNSSVLHEGHVYGLDEGILACVEVRTGERKWKAGRYGYGQVILADGHLIVMTESGDLVLLEATPEGHRELSRFSAIQGKTWNNPALADGRLLVRNAVEMACFDVSSR